MTNINMVTIDMYRKTIGVMLIVGALFTFSMAKWPDAVSAKESTTVTIIENFYGLNMNMHLERSLVVMLILGMVLYVSSRKETES